MENRRIMEYFLIAMLLSLGIPVAVLVGFGDGERLATAAYPDAKPASPSPERSWRGILLASEDGVEKGRKLFQSNCIACHGAFADGKGAAAASLVPPPRDFLDLETRWTRTREPLDIYKSISEGSPGTSMIGFSAMLPVEDRWAIVHYLGTLPGVSGKFKPVDEALASTWKPEAGR